MRSVHNLACREQLPPPPAAVALSQERVWCSGLSYKQERVKGLTWAQVSHQQQLWDRTQPIQIFFYFGKTIGHYSYVQDLDAYAQVYSKLMEKEFQLRSLADLVTIALEE